MYNLLHTLLEDCARQAISYFYAFSCVYYTSHIFHHFLSFVTFLWIFLYINWFSSLNLLSIYFSFLISSMKENLSTCYRLKTLFLEMKSIPAIISNRYVRILKGSNFRRIHRWLSTIPTHISCINPIKACVRFGLCNLIFCSGMWNANIVLLQIFFNNSRN